MVAITAQSVSLTALRQQLGTLFDRTRRRDGRLVIERGGVPIAAIVSLQDLERLELLDQEWEAPFAVFDEMRERFKDVSPKELQREADRAVAEVRADRRAAQFAASQAKQLVTTASSCFAQFLMPRRWRRPSPRSWRDAREQILVAVSP